MKVTIAIIGFSLLLVGCKDHPTSLPAEVQVIVGYRSGFQGDSIIVKIDGQVQMQGPGFSDSLNVPAGCSLIMVEGLHWLRLEIPQQNTQAETWFIAKPNYITDIEADFNRNQHSITYEIILRSVN